MVVVVVDWWVREAHIEVAALVLIVYVESGIF